MVLLVDMDEVFSDFVGGACKVHGVDPEFVKRYRVTFKTWEIVTAIESYKNRGSDNKVVFTQKDFWAKILVYEYMFWKTLNPLPWAYELRAYLDGLDCEWYLVSSPFNSEDCHRGKIQWIHRFFGKRFDRFILTPYKHLLAKEGAVLIDDSPINCEKFQNNGGLSYLYGSSPLASFEAAQDPVGSLQQFIVSINRKTP